MAKVGSSKQTIGLTGDWLFTRPLSIFKEPAYLKMRNMLNAADAVFANLEASVHPYFEDPLASRHGGGSYMTCEPSLLPDMKWMGVNLVACGSSHADDYGPTGIMDTIRYFDEAGITHAGSGRHLGEARTPGYLDTANGRIALVAVTAQFRNGSQAAEQRYDNAGYPGVNAFRHKEIRVVDKKTLDMLRKIGKDVGWEAEIDRRAYQGDPGAKSNDPNSYNFLGHTFQLGKKFALASKPNQSDLDNNLAQIRHAKANADRVVVSFHCHEQGGPTYFTAKKRADVEDLADFGIEFGRKAIEAGADIFVAHGPQVPGAVEIYKGRPLFYGMGSFVFQIETIKVLPAEAYERYNLGDRATPSDFIEARYAGGTRGHVGDPEQWRQVYAICDFDGDKFKEARLYPIDLGQKRSRTQRGRPLPADPKLAATILKRIQHRSANYGTKVAIKSGIGVIKG